MLSGKPDSFRLSDFSIDTLSEKYEAIATAVDLKSDPDPIALNLGKLYEGNANPQSVRSLFFRQLHLLGIVGIKRTATS